MAINTPVKIGIGLATVGGTSGVAYAIHQQLTTPTKNLKDNPISIGQTLTNKGHTLLNFNIKHTEDKTTWDPIVKAYAQSAKKLNNVTIKITPADGTPTQDDINSLKQACAQVIKSNNNEETLKIAEQYCVTPITIKAFLSKWGTPLDTNDNDQGNTKEWDDKVKAYPTQGTKPLGELTLNSGDEKAKRNQIRKPCRDIEGKQTYDADFHTNFAKFEEWCFVARQK